jgi:hypothetical protein
LGINIFGTFDRRDNMMCITSSITFRCDAMPYIGRTLP